MSLFKSVALIGKYKSPEIAEPLLKLASFLAQRGVAVKLDTLTAEHIGRNDHAVASLDEIGATCELAVVIGGDGTMLNIARTFAPYDVALVGVNKSVDGFGFLTDLSMETMTESIGSILDVRFREPRRGCCSESEVVFDGYAGKARCWLSMMCPSTKALTAA